MGYNNNIMNVNVFCLGENFYIFLVLVLLLYVNVFDIIKALVAWYSTVNT